MCLTIGIRARLLHISLIARQNIKEHVKPRRRIYQQGNHVQWKKLCILESKDEGIHSISWRLCMGCCGRRILEASRSSN